jgi:hypothetical protein
MEVTTYHGKKNLMGTTAPQKITAVQVNVGDLIARAKKGPFKKVTNLSNGESAVWITFEEAGRIRPSFTTALWRMPAETETEAPAAAEKAPKAKAPKATPAGFEWPKAAAEVLLDYLSAEVSGDQDAPNHDRPFIDPNGVLRVHSDHWRGWLTDQGLSPSKGEAAAPLRDAGLGVRSFPLPGQNGKARGFYTGPAPKGTEDLPRRARATRAAAAPRNAFARVPENQRSYLARLVIEADEGEMRDEVLAALIGAAPATPAETPAPAASKATGPFSGASVLAGAREAAREDGVTRVPASELKVGDVIGTTRSDTRQTIESGQGTKIAKLTSSPEGRFQARDARGKIIRSLAPATMVWRGQDA